MSKITYTYPHDGLSIKTVHAYHQETLFFEILFPLIEQQTEDESLENDLFGNIAENWAKQELGVLGFVSTYHMWERQLQELFLEQKERSHVEIPLMNPRENIVQYGKRVLLDTFEASIAEAYWQELDIARKIVNAFKHGPGKNFNSTLAAHPNYFYVPDDNRHLPMVSISLEQLRRLINTVAEFWEAVPRKIIYPHS